MALVFGDVTFHANPCKTYLYFHCLIHISQSTCEVLYLLFPLPRQLGESRNTGPGYKWTICDLGHVHILECLFEHDFNIFVSKLHSMLLIEVDIEVKQDSALLRQGHTVGCCNAVFVYLPSMWEMSLEELSFSDSTFILLKHNKYTGP